ncbi:hypothetical protein [Brevibacillus agri]|uniref:hypothetical protein n=1 Tax=Brevibacillus agri TaxID=51101 RepID=UPI0018CD1750|nr:hypothetical protein [Brevibacillus agri]MBG9565625.1 hypothetical protein [Brevibacillus agri]
MDIKYLSPGDAIEAINSGKVIRFDTSDGFTTMRKKKVGYEIRIHNEQGEVERIYNGDIRNVLKTLNGEISDKWYLWDTDRKGQNIQ